MRSLDEAIEFDLDASSTRQTKNFFRDNTFVYREKNY